MKQTLSIMFVLVCMTTLLASANAKRGCANYGHSCYGGHGKRSEIVEVFPRDDTPSYRELLEEARRESLSSDDTKDVDARPQYKLLRMIRQWMEEMRPPQKMGEPSNMSNEIFKESLSNAI